MIILNTDSTAQICHTHLIHFAKHTLASETQELMQKVALNFVYKNYKLKLLTCSTFFIELQVHVECVSSRFTSLHQ